MNFIRKALILFNFFIFYTDFTSGKSYFKIEYKWSQIEFDFPTEEERNQAIKNGTFKEGKIQPIDVQVYHDDRNKFQRKFFVTCPRIYDGIPATLGIITDKLRQGNPVITPYPNWEWHTNIKECKEHGIFSVYRVFVDECDRLWVLDNGRIGDKQICPPQILAFDLKTDSLLHRYEIPFDQHLNNSLYLTPVVEVKSHPTSCEDTFVYNADPTGTSLLVYDLKNNKSWRIIDKTFYPDPSYKTYNIDGKKFEVMDGILGLALSPPGPERKLFYHAMSSVTENWIYTKYLKNESLFPTSERSFKLFKTYKKTRRTQSAAEAMDSRGNLYFGLLGDIKIAAWNMINIYSESYFRIIGDDEKTMQFPSGMKVTADENGEEWLYIFSTAYQKLATNRLFSNETNFRILSGKTEDLLKAHDCEKLCFH